jgi:nucleoside-diphosphate-sugar epimerase
VQRALVTGVAGFVGSHLADALLARGIDVVGVDCLTPYYDVAVKRANVPAGICLVETDLRDAALGALLDGVDVVFHQAGQPGVRLSWSSGFADYVGHNILATQRLLEACATSTRPPRVVYASSSSVYGRAAAYPTSEADLPRPHSPYGVTKLAAEHLCGLYAANHGLSTVSLRYFTVYGPRQRPDMAMHRLIEAALHRTPFPLYGDGSARRDFTFVADVVAANLAAATAEVEPGTVVNVAGGGDIAVADLIELVGEVVGEPVPVERLPLQPGDVDRTGGSIERARDLLGWSPQVEVRTGVEAQVDWHRAQLPTGHATP